MEEKTQKSPIVIDVGSFECKSGFAGEEGPRAITPTLIGRKYLKETNYKFRGIQE